jgi:tripeptidyl-peptidase I
VSLRAHDFLIQTNGGLRRVTGTSASAPVFASMLARVNNARLLANKTTVGFVSPILYAFKDKIMRDVDTGYIFGCGIARAFEATSGWDAVTGLGSPKFEKMMEVFLNLP